MAGPRHVAPTSPDARPRRVVRRCIRQPRRRGREVVAQLDRLRVCFYAQLRFCPLTVRLVRGIIEHMFEATAWDVASQGPEPLPPADLDAFDAVPLTDAQ